MIDVQLLVESLASAEGSRGLDFHAWYW